MTAHNSLSIILKSRWGMHDLPRMFQSLAWQSGDLARVEVVFVDTGESSEVSQTAKLWAGILPGSFTHLKLPETTPDFHAANLGTAAASGDLVVHPHQTVRLDPYFMEDTLRAFEKRKHLDVLYSDFVDIGEAAAGLVQLPRFAKWRLKGKNVIGPMAVYRHEALATLPGLRPDTPFAAWDLAIQGALRGLNFHCMDRAAYACSLPRPEANEARQGAAMVVINNQGFFNKEVVRWALAAARRSPWALRAEPFRIPVAREARQLMNDHVNDENGQRQGWLWRFKESSNMEPAVIPAYDTEG